MLTHTSVWFIKLVKVEIFIKVDPLSVSYDYVVQTLSAKANVGKDKI